MVILIIVILCNVLLKGFLKVILIFIGIVVGYIILYFMGLVDFSIVNNVSFFVVLNVKLVYFDMNVIFIILLVVFVVIVEYVGYLKVISSIVGKDLVIDLGLYRFLFGDGLLIIIFGMFGLVFIIIYGENIGVLVLIKVYSVYVISGVGLVLIILGFLGKILVFISIIFILVIGGVSILLFGIIVIFGLRIFIEEKVDFFKLRNLIFVLIIFVVGMSGIKLILGNLELKGMGLVIIVVIVLSLSFMIFDKLGIMNEVE